MHQCPSPDLGLSQSPSPAPSPPVLHPITWAAPEQTVRWNFLAEPPGEQGHAVKLSQGRDNTHWAKVYYLQNKYSFPLAAWASWTWRPPIWQDWLASEFQVSGCLCHHPFARLPSPRVRHQVWLSTALGSQLKTPCFHDKQLTISSATPTTHYILQLLFLFFQLLIFFLKFSKLSAEGWLMFNINMLQWKHLLLYSIQHKILHK